VSGQDEFNFDVPPAIEIRFSGPDYSAVHDLCRLTGRLARIWKVMRGGGWRTLGEIAGDTGDPEAFWSSKAGESAPHPEYFTSFARSSIVAGRPSLSICFKSAIASRFARSLLISPRGETSSPGVMT
jgi:hypothetical protein